MKAKSILQIGGNEIALSLLEQRIKQLWTASGNLIKDIKDLRLYVKPEENRVYYVINDVFSGNMDLLN